MYIFFVSDGQKFIDNLCLTGKEDILEIGVGTGRLALKTAVKCKKFTGIDISPKTNVNDNNKAMLNTNFLTFLIY